MAIGKRTYVLDLFAGGGGLTLGFHQAGFKNHICVDFNKHAIATLKHNFKDCIALHKDLTQFTPRQLNKIIGKKRIQVIIGGPPCQGFSKMNTMKTGSLSEDKRNHLYKNFLQFVKHYKPKVCLIENVTGMQEFKFNVPKRIAKELSSLGYNVTYQVLNAADYSTPQNRKRLIFVGVLKKYKKTFKMPKPHNKIITTKEAISDLPRLKMNTFKPEVRNYTKFYNLSKYAKQMRKGSKKLHDHITFKQNTKDKTIIKYINKGYKHFDIPIKFRKHRLKQEKKKFTFRFLCNKWDEPFRTIVATMQTTQQMHCHPKQLRSITVREGARIQSFPDKFQFITDSKYHKQRLIGNSVPPRLAKALALAIKKQLF